MWWARKKRMSSTTNHVTGKGQTSYLDNTIHVNFLLYGSLHLQSDNIKFRALLCFSLESHIFPKFKNVILRFLVAFFQVFHNWQKLFGLDSHVCKLTVVNPLSPRINIQILQTDLYTFLLRIVERIWFKIKAFSLW